MVTRCSTAAPNRAMDWSCSDYVLALEEERKKIKVFQRELPLCMKLVTQAIERLRQQMDDRPVLEEFIPLKPSPSSSSLEERIRRDAQMSTLAAGTRLSEKLDWLKSVQLWNQSAETEAAEPPPPPPPPPPVKPIAVSANGGGAFHPFVTENKIATPASSDASKEDACVVAGADGGGEDKKEGQPQAHRKTRRSWSPALHRRFLHALEQLGGSHVATPKQIKELMKVDGLTNDEVKSHLQKYRLYDRRQSPDDKRTENIHREWYVGSTSGIHSSTCTYPCGCTCIRLEIQAAASNSSSSETTTAAPSFTKNIRTYR